MVDTIEAVSPFTTGVDRLKEAHDLVWAIIPEISGRELVTTDEMTDRLLDVANSIMELREVVEDDS